MLAIFKSHNTFLKLTLSSLQFEFKDRPQPLIFEKIALKLRIEKYWLRPIPFIGIYLLVSLAPSY
ncbi:MAG: hypothetical protein M3275_13165, partial [Thermoproteota archaeon]|nr:hypothetical protein [Thermoproteota archaeon]